MIKKLGNDILAAYKRKKDMDEKKIDIDYIEEELDKFVKPNGDFGYGTLYDVATHFYKLGINDTHKMTILEILPLFLKGEKIRRESWDKNAYIYKDGVYFHFVYNNNGAKGDDIWYLSERIFALDDLMGNDWHSVLSKPKFKVGDWIVNNTDKSKGQITEILYDKEDPSLYGYNHTNGYFANVFENDYHIWTIKDAEPGDVLMCESGWTCIFKELDLDNNTFSSYCFMATCLDFMPYGSECHTLDNRVNGELTPATEKQHKIFFKKMKEAGYGWNPDKKELYIRNISRRVMY